MNKLFISPEAQKDLLEIKRYIEEELDNSIAALTVISKITKRIRGLIDYPLSGALLSSRIDINVNYRYLVCENYLAFYRVEKNEIFVDRVLYGGRDYIKILFKSRNGEIKE